MGQGEPEQPGRAVLLPGMSSRVGPGQRQKVFASPPLFRDAVLRDRKPSTEAYQIAAALDKLSSTVDRRYMFWSITLTYMLSVRTLPPL